MKISALNRKLHRAFGGRVTVESRAETGTAFTLHFPA